MPKYILREKNRNSNLTSEFSGLKSDWKYMGILEGKSCQTLSKDKEWFEINIKWGVEKNHGRNPS